MGKRLWLLVAVLTALLGVALAEPLCVNAGGWALLTDQAGETLLGGVETVFAVREGALYAVGRKGAYRLCDDRGKLLSDVEFAMIDDMGDCLVFRQGDRYGAMDAEGNVLLEARWTQLTSDGMGGWLALETDPMDDTADAILRINESGEATPTGVATALGLSPLRGDRMPVMGPDGRYGAIDGRGTLAIPSEWRYIGPFENGFAKASGETGLGLIDADGLEAIPCIYSWLERGDGFIAAGDSGGVDIYTSDGQRVLFSVAGDGLEATVVGGFVAIKSGATTRLYRATGEIVMETEAPIAFSAGIGGQLVASDGLWGERCVWLMDPDGSAASRRYQWILNLAGGRYVYMTMAGSAYYSADLGRVQTSWDYASARYGLLDGEGRELTPAAYTEIRVLSADRLLLADGDGVYLADLDGSILHSWPER